MNCSQKLISFLIVLSHFFNSIYAMEEQSPKNNINTASKPDSELLRRAVENGQSHLVKILLENGVNPNEPSPFPIRTAVRNNDIETVKALLSDKRTELSTTLYYTAGKGNIPMLKLLLKAPSLLNSPYKNNMIYDALGEASFFAQADAVVILLPHFSNDSVWGKNPLITAVEKDNSTITRLLLNSGKIKIPGDILKFAVINGNLDIILQILNHNSIDKNYDDSIGVRTAVSEKKHDALELLLKDPDIYVSENLKSDDEKISTLLNDYFASINKDKKFCLGQDDPISLEAIPEDKIIFWRENGVVQCFNEDSLSEHIAVNSPTNPLTRAKLPERIIRKLSITITIFSIINDIKISVPRDITIGLFILNLWKRFEQIPNNLECFNFYLNDTNQSQLLLGAELFTKESLFNLNPANKLATLSSNIRLEVSSHKDARKHIDLGKIIPYLKKLGIPWVPNHW